MRRAVLVAAAALALPSPAAAKEPIRATICGLSACTTVTDPVELNQIPGGEASEPLGSVAPYYRVTMVAGEHGDPHNQHSFSMYYLPTANAMAWAETGTVRAHPIFGEPTTELMRELTAGLEPFPAPRPTTVLMRNRPVRGASTYTRLFEQTRQAEPGVSPSDWVGVDLRAARPSPWTELSPDLMYSPSANVLEIGGGRVAVSEALAADIEAGRALEDPASSLPWGTLGLSAVGALFLASLRRRR